MNLSSSLLVNDRAFRGCPFHTQPRYYHMSPMNPFTRWMLQTGVFGGFHNFLSFFVASVPTCFKCVSCIKVRKNDNANQVDAVEHWNILSCSLLFSGEFVSEGLANDLFSSCFTQRPSFRGRECKRTQWSLVSSAILFLKWFPYLDWTNCYSVGQ